MLVPIPIEDRRPRPIVSRWAVAHNSAEALAFSSDPIFTLSAPQSDRMVIRCSPGLVSDIDAIADRQGITRSDLVRIASALYVQAAVGVELEGEVVTIQITETAATTVTPAA